MSEQDHLRLHAFFSGWVQGVGFRFTTIRVARNYDVVGFVRNLRDGRVELVAEGAKGELASFLAFLQGEMGRHIEAIDTSWLPASGEFDEFGIEY